MFEQISISSKSDALQLIHKMANLVQISVTLNTTLDIDRLLQFILDTGAELLDCEAVSILLFDEKRGELKFAAATGSDPEELAKIPVPLKGSIAGEIFTKNRPHLSNNLKRDPRHFGKVGKKIGFDPHCLVGVPMRIRERVTGVLEALNKREGNFTPMDTQILSVIASQAAVAIHNARLVHALQQANIELSQADKLKSDFISVASHELRTPLGVIMGYASFLKEDAQGEQSEHAEYVLNAATKMRSLLEDMSNMNMLYMGSADLDLQPTPIQSIIKIAYQEVAATAEAQSETLVLNLPPSPITINADAIKLAMVFVNLLSNAVKFSPERGEITVSMSASDNDVCVIVKDNGIGIPSNQLERVFEKFYQVEDHMTRRIGGLGLGLAIARGLTELHNGRIWAESDGLGKGSTFTVFLPRYKA